MKSLESIDFGHRQLVVRSEPAVALRASWRSITVLSILGAAAMVLAVLALRVSGVLDHIR